MVHLKKIATVGRGIVEYLALSRVLRIAVKKTNMTYDNRGVSPLKIKESTYNKNNVEMRKENPTMGSKLTSGTNPRRVSFACRFGGMKGPMKEKSGEPTSKALALKKWGFGSVEAANAFCRKHKKS